MYVAGRVAGSTAAEKVARERAKGYRVCKPALGREEGAAA